MSASVSPSASADARGADELVDTQWFQSNQGCYPVNLAPPALLDKYPLSQRCVHIAKNLPLMGDDLKLSEVRPKMAVLDLKFAHSFKLGDQWHSFGPRDLKSFYKARSLHMVGKQRLNDWADSASGAVGGETPGCPCIPRTCSYS